MLSAECIHADEKHSQFKVHSDEPGTLPIKIYAQMANGTQRIKGNELEMELNITPGDQTVEIVLAQGALGFGDMLFVSMGQDKNGQIQSPFYEKFVPLVAA